MRSSPCPSTSSSSSASRGHLGGDRRPVAHLARRRARGAGSGSRRAASLASATRSRRAASPRDLDAEDPGRAPHDHAQLVGLVVLEPERHPEAVAQRSREQAGARRRADERERRHLQRERPRRGALSDDDVEPEVLQRRVEHLFDGAREPVDLVDEQDVARLERGQDRGHVALPLQRRPRTQRMPTPSSSRTMYARLVLPSPGGPTSNMWSSGSPAHAPP